ncbi:DUF3427 domain-containing protein [Salipaludibacillus daqingensis]|uniref:DUF3427 domain-containing protein n=1 Tax=Salipaludibacillus daqingensis TaxID=3041001 RepID=UPI002475F929|nr:DEAD/DEAH box helicase [Salipaludibacillus daqingensis]
MRDGIYEQVITDDLRRQLKELGDDEFYLEESALDVEEARKMLASYVSTVTRRALRFVREREGNNDGQALLKQIQMCNQVIAKLSSELDDEASLAISEEGRVLEAVYAKLNTERAITHQKSTRPVTPISESSLFTGSHYEPNMLSEMKKEILTSDRVDMLVSFIKWSGIRCIIDELRRFTSREGTHLRIITTSYMEATDYKAIVELSKLPNTEIQVSYDVKRTRLHAKAYLFHRETGFTTAYIGSSNLSNPALTSGLEWNMKVTEKDSFDIINKFNATFESYWNDQEYQLFDAREESDHDRLKQALSKKESTYENDIHFMLDIQPYHYQQEILEKLQAERDIFGRHKNLIVAATGVGKTVVSAFDYKRFAEKQTRSQRPRLLFVAHREEILKQSRDTFRAILKDFNFGDLFVGRHTPEEIDHLFISIQTFNSIKLYEKTSADFYDYIIVDEFHHAAAKSYQTLLNYYEPSILLGLTATPERMDGEDILQYFDYRIASEMRLTEAVDRKLLSPFHYFCVSDTEDLSKLQWSKRGYDLKELENVYTHNTRRSTQVIKSIETYVTDVDEVKGLGFCVGIEHAKYMADFFNMKGIPSVALYGQTDKETRDQAKAKLKSGELRFIFVVDLYNEGVDIPEVNTVLFLRPTESLTVFMQQLGRGLRLADGKECLTVLDFIGRAHKNYKFEDKFRSLIGKTKHSVKHFVDHGFFNLPKGCFIQLEKQAKEYVLQNISQSANTKAHLISKLVHFTNDTGLALTLSNFLSYEGISIFDFYGKSRNRTFERMKVEAGVGDDFTSNHEDVVTKRLSGLFHLNSERFLAFLLEYMKGLPGRMVNVDSDEERKMELMLYYTFFDRESPLKAGYDSAHDALKTIFSHERLIKEVVQVLEYLYETLKTVEKRSYLHDQDPLGVHSTYSTAQVMAALGLYTEESCPNFREGVKHFPEKNLDIFFITLNKSEKDFSPSTLYEDYAINDRLFHWQSQSRVSDTSDTAKRYRTHRSSGHQIALFVREYKKEQGLTAPFTFLGTCNYVSHSGSKPVSFIWKLDEPIAPWLAPKANKSIL